MAFLSTTLLTLAAGALVAQAVPTSRDSSANLELAKTYAPQWRFHSDEQYFPSSIDFFLKNVDLLDADGKSVNNDPTVSTVDDAAGQGAGMFLSTDIDASRDGWLKGQNPSTDPTSVYTFVAPKDNGVIDLYYWLWTPFNAGKDVPLVGRVGDHVGDWERMTVRTVDGVATTVDFHAHSDTGSTVPWSEAPKFDSDKRPVGYIARGSHGIWKDVGDHTYVNAVVFKLQDITNDGGVAWDTRDSIVALDFPGTFSGDQDWLNYKGAFGNDGETDCWWHVFYDECEVVAGPPGPYRPDTMSAAKVGSKKFASSESDSQVSSTDDLKWKMDGTLSQVIGSAIDADKSSFTIYLSESSISSAKDTDAKYIGVQQTCESAESDKETAITRRDTAKATSTTVATTALDLESNKFTVTPAACESGTRVAAYTVALCSSEDKDSCTFDDDSERALRAYSKEASVSGVQDSSAIEVVDLDNWNL